LHRTTSTNNYRGIEFNPSALWLRHFFWPYIYISSPRLINTRPRLSIILYNHARRSRLGTLWHYIISKGLRAQPGGGFGDETAACYSFPPALLGSAGVLLCQYLSGVTSAGEQLRRETEQRPSTSMGMHWPDVRLRPTAAPLCGVPPRTLPPPPPRVIAFPPLLLGCPNSGTASMFSFRLEISTCLHNQKPLLHLQSPPVIGAAKPSALVVCWVPPIIQSHTTKSPGRMSNPPSSKRNYGWVAYK
jgi:hypothetical protein